MIRRSLSDNHILLFNPKIELTLRAIRRTRRQDNMANNQQLGERRTLADYVMPTMTNESGGIVIPDVGDRHFELKPAIIQMVQNNSFHGLAGEDPYAHLSSFNNVCQTFKMHGMSDGEVRLRLFPFSLKDKAQLWVASLPRNSITTWDGLKQAFLHKYFPPQKTAKLRNEITTFKQTKIETLYTA